jgi:polyhydroxyalkanoate synthase subunit PhaC
VGGTILATALAVLAARGLSGAKSPVASATLLTTFLDFTDTGILDVFVDEGFVQYRERQFAEGGFLKGQELATTFSFLRPNELVWNYLQNNYLKGETPPAFDLLFWNSDSTNLPGPMYAWYLRQTYLENNLRKPGRVRVCGEAIDLSKVTVPAYLYGSREDHIVPIGGAYASMHVLGGDKRFVMGASGHIAGVINPPAANKRSHWIAEGLKIAPQTHAAWLDKATERPGSWWPDWMQWLKGHAGRQVAAPKAYAAMQPGRKAAVKAQKFSVIEPAPGRYVRAKA